MRSQLIQVAADELESRTNTNKNRLPEFDEKSKKNHHSEAFGQDLALKAVRILTLRRFSRPFSTPCPTKKSSE